MSVSNRRLIGGLAGLTASVTAGWLVGEAISSSQERISAGRANAESCLSLVAGEDRPCDLTLLKLSIGDLVLDASPELHSSGAISIMIDSEEIESTASDYLKRNPQMNSFGTVNEALIAGGFVTSAGLGTTAYFVLRRKKPEESQTVAEPSTAVREGQEQR